MDFSIAQMPTWTIVLFIVFFTTVPAFLLVHVFREAAIVQKQPRLSKSILLCFVGYLIVVALITLTGWFAKNTLPPRIIFTTTIPLFLFYSLFVKRAKWFKTIAPLLALDRLLLFHLFRIVGVFFFIATYYEALPQGFAIMAGTGDVITALLTLPLIAAWKRYPTRTKPFVWLWNCFGLLDILAVVAYALILSVQALENGSPGVQQMGTFPFSWIPAFAPATIVFSHFLIFEKLRITKL
ncbi:MAG: hypothetical protein AAGF77_11790 [Bacteroidota bacterium]